MATTTRYEPAPKKPETTGQTVIDAVNDKMEAVGDKVKNTAAAVGDYAGQAKDKVQDKVQEWTSSAADGLGQAKDKAQEWAQDAAHLTGEKLQDVGEDLTALIRRHPVPALLIGFGLGFLLAKVARSS